MLATVHDRVARQVRALTDVGGDRELLEVDRRAQGVGVACAARRRSAAAAPGARGRPPARRASGRARVSCGPTVRARCRSAPPSLPVRRPPCRTASCTCSSCRKKARISASWRLDGPAGGARVAAPAEHRPARPPRRPPRRRSERSRARPAAGPTRSGDPCMPPSFLAETITSGAPPVDANLGPAAGSSARSASPPPPSWRPRSSAARPGAAAPPARAASAPSGRPQHPRTAATAGGHARATRRGATASGRRGVDDRRVVARLAGERLRVAGTTCRSTRTTLTCGGEGPEGRRGARRPGPASAASSRPSRAASGRAGRRLPRRADGAAHVRRARRAA